MFLYHHYSSIFTFAMSPVPPSAIALSSIFFYNCIIAIFAYLTNVMHMSMFQLIIIQTVNLPRPRIPFKITDETDPMPCCLCSLHSHQWRPIWTACSSWYTSRNMVHGYSGGDGNCADSVQPQPAHAVRACHCYVHTAFHYRSDVLDMAW